ncbi:MAG: protease SohB [Oleiphilaceae bacterium]|nr:protease SohB [Oleiphilaceae bacterium]
MEFLSEYGIFLAKVVTIVLAIMFILAAAGEAALKNRKQERKELRVDKLNDKLDDTLKELEDHILDKDTLKKQRKAEKKAQKEQQKSGAVEDKKRVYVLSFDGDIKASAVDTFREAVTAVLAIARPDKDEVVVKLESPGGMVHGYGLAAAQLDRIKHRNIPLTACVDKVAASGGYMMACVADKIVASPFAIMGSIGVVAQLPNFHRLLKKNDIDVEILTAGEYKRTLTMFGENTEKGRRKFQEDLEDTHVLFKEYVSEHRPVVDIEKVANGDIWFGSRAKEVNLVDDLQTSDDYLMEACKSADVYTVDVKEKQHLMDKLGAAVSSGVSRSIERVFGDWRASRGLS